MRPISSETPEDRQQGICQAELLPENVAQLFPRSLLPRIQRPRGHSSFRGIHCPEDTPSESVAILRSILPVTSKTMQQPTSLISTYIHGVHYAARLSHVSNVATTLTSAQTVIEGSRNHSRNHEHNVMKESHVQIMWL